MVTSKCEIGPGVLFEGNHSWPRSANHPSGMLREKLAGFVTMEGAGKTLDVS
jgi:hypothetical protein